MTKDRVCSNCKESKEENSINFRQRQYTNGTNYFHSICRECERENSRKYSQQHRKERQEYSKKFREQNPEYVKNWKKNNKDKINKSERDRRNNDINFKLKKNVSRSINRAIKKKGKSIIKYLPFTIDQLKQHLEQQFDEKMSWENYGIYWHIDHIIPHSEFQYSSMEDEEFKKCWSLNNLRPLEARQNMLDGAAYTRHKKRLNQRII